MSFQRRRQRPGVVLALGALAGAGLVELGTFAAAPTAPPPIVMVLQAPAPVAEPVAKPVEPEAKEETAAATKVEPPAAGAPDEAAQPDDAEPVSASRAEPERGEKKEPPPPEPPKPVGKSRFALSRLPDGVVAGLRRNAEAANSRVGRELVAGAKALELGTAYTAWTHFSRVLQLERDNRDALMGVALCHAELNQKKAADRALDRLLTLDPTHPQASILRGFNAQLSGNASAAVEWYERALPRLSDESTAEELRAVIAMLQPQVTLAPTATARAERAQ